MRRILYIAILLGGFLVDGWSQQVPLYSQYMLNGFLLNPAAAGSEGYTAVNLTAREQWIGLQNGPGTYALEFSDQDPEEKLYLPGIFGEKASAPWFQER